MFAELLNSRIPLGRISQIEAVTFYQSGPRHNQKINRPKQLVAQRGPYVRVPLSDLQKILQLLDIHFDGGQIRRQRLCVMVNIDDLHILSQGSSHGH